MAEVKTTIETSIPAWIDVRQHYGIEVIGIIQGKLTIPKEKVEEDLLTIHAALEPEGGVEYSFPCRVSIDQKQVQSDLLQGWLTLEDYYPGYDVLFGKMVYREEEGSYTLMQGRVRYEVPLASTILRGQLKVEKAELEEVVKDDPIEVLVPIDPSEPTPPTIPGGDGEVYPTIKGGEDGSTTYYVVERKRNEIPGYLHYAISGRRQTILRGSLNTSKDRMEKDLLRGSLSTTKDLSTAELQGHLEYERGMKAVGIYAKCSLSKDDVVEPLLHGKVGLEVEDEKLDLLTGKLTIAGYYSAADFPCRISVRKRELVHSIMSRIDVPPMRKVEIPCTIEVDGANCANQVILQGKVDLLKEDVTVDLASGKVTLLPTAYVDIDCHAKMDPVYTRREFVASVNAVQTSELELPATVAVTPPADYWYHQEILYCRMAVGERATKAIPSTIDVQGQKRIYSTFPRPPKKPKARIAIVVSPTWRYEAFVFKSSLVTFLDRYYRKLDLEIVFGGSPRSDFDIFNLAANYRIRRENLINVPIEVDFKNRDRMDASINRFIRCMAFDCNGHDAPISRVFIFMNQPSWYYSDPVGKVAQFCKDKGIPCVAIDSGGEYHEMLDVDRARDASLNHLEWDRQQKMHPVYAYENVKLPNVDPNRIVY